MSPSSVALQQNYRNHLQSSVATPFASFFCHLFSCVCCNRINLTKKKKKLKIHTRLGTSTCITHNFTISILKRTAIAKYLYFCILYNLHYVHRLHCNELVYAFVHSCGALHIHLYIIINIPHVKKKKERKTGMVSLKCTYFP